jgi:hypothetical protein
VRGVILLDHLNTGPTILSNLINVRALHQPQTYVGVS